MPSQRLLNELDHLAAVKAMLAEAKADAQLSPEELTLQGVAVTASIPAEEFARHILVHRRLNAVRAA